MENNSISASFILYTISIIAIGLYSIRRSVKTQEDYYLAGRGLGPWIGSISASASSESGWVLLGLVGISFNGGISAFWLLPGCIAGYLFNWILIAPRLRQISSDSKSITLPDFLVARFGGSSLSIRLISTSIIAISMISYVAAQMNAAGKAFSGVFDTNYPTGVLIGAIIILIYTVTGGFRAVAWTDLIQGFLMVFTLAILPIITLYQIGGLTETINQLRIQDVNLLSMTSDKVGFGLIGFVAGWVGIGLAYPGLPHVLVRFMSIKDKEAIKRGTIIATIWAFIVFSGAITLGLTTRTILGSLPDAEQALPIIAVQILPGVLAGLILAAILAAICSTADSQLIVAASSIANDIIHKVFGKDLQPTTLAIINRITVLILGILATLFALSENRLIFTFVLYAWSALGASFGPVVILSLWWKRFTKVGAISGMLTGSIVTVAWRELGLSSMIYELVPAFFMSLIISMIMSIIVNDKEYLKDN